MFRRLAANTQGAVLVFTAIALSVLIASTALGIEVGGWYLTTRHMQGASDAAAISAAASYVAGEVTYQSVGYRYASKNGFCDKGHVSPCDPNSTSNNVTVTVSAVTNNKIRVDIWDAPQPWFVQAVWKLVPYQCGNDSTDQYACLHVHSIVSLHATSSGGGNGCLLGLSKTVTALKVAGGANLNAHKCVAASDTCPGDGVTASCPNPGFTLDGTSSIDIAQLIVATQQPYSCGSNPKCQIGQETTTSPLWTPDPFATLQMPTPGTCAQFPKPDGRGVTIFQPGTYCSNIQVNAHDNVIFEPGQYILNNASFMVIGGAVNQCVLLSATVASQGTTPYKNGDPVTVVGGTTAPGVGAATLQLTVNPKTKTITGATVTNAGAYVDTTNPDGSKTCSLPAGLTNPVAVTGGKGTGATFNLTFGVTNSTDPDPATNGVTFILTGSGSSIGQVKISGANVSLSAPFCGANPCSQANDVNDLLFWQDKNAITAGGTFDGSAVSLFLQGALYFPSQQVKITGGLTFGSTNCTSIVANTIDFEGSGTFNKGCLPTASTVGGGSSGSFSLTE
jgi:putative Flp pilus-assembly TadE/G-like protein